MGIIAGINPDTLLLQIRSLMVCDFLNEYNHLEQTIRKVFEENVATLPPNIKHQLYFYYGGKIGTYIEYESQSVKLNELNYSEKELFRNLSINQIIKIFNDNKKLEAFNFSIESIQRSTAIYPFYDCIIRLLNMRNKLAHEVIDLNFKDRDIIELLSPEQISQEPFELLQNYDLLKMDGITQYIASNIIFIRKIASKLTYTQ